MPDVRCPMCGKPNPAEADVCQFCQARLRPVWETGPFKDAPAGQEKNAEPDPADWLRALGEDAGGPASPQQAPAPEPEQPGDWLGGLRDQTAEPEQDDAGVRPMDDLPGETPDWLSRLGLGDAPAQPPAAPEPGAAGPGAAFTGDASSWSSLSEDAGLPEPDWLKPGPQPDEWRTPQSGDELPDWLRTPAEPGEQSPAEDLTPPGEEELPAWLLDRAAPEQPAPAADAAMEEETPPADEGELPEWLLTMVTSGQPPAEVDAPPPDEDLSPAQGEELPAWLSGVEASEPSPAEAQPSESWGVLDDQPEPASQADEAAPGEGEALPGRPGRPAEDETPAWLRAAMREDADEDEALDAGLIYPEDAALPPPESIFAAEEPAAASDDPLAWLSELEAASPAAPGSQPPADAGGEEEDFAAWIASVGAADATAGQPRPPAAGEEPDWMAGSAPSWLQEFAPEQPEAPGSKPLQAERPGWLPGGSDAGAEVFSPTPDSSELIEAMRADAERLQSAPDPLPSDADEYNLDWLGKLEDAYPGMTLETDAEGGGFGSPVEDPGVSGEAAPGELPAWLSGEGPMAEAGELTDEDALNPGELPGWLMGMRPDNILAAEQPNAPASAFEQVEGAGPLAGLRGVLPAEPDIAQAEKPPTYSVLLQVTDVQNAQAKLLADLVAGETETPALAGPQKLGSQSALRWIAALLLIVSLLVSMLTGLPVMYRPAPPPELSAVRQIIDGLDGSAKVLVAVDYEPGYSGEMDAAARAALAHLLRRGLAPTFISTLPTGPMQIERLMAQVGRAESRTLVSGEQYTNLGYFPGGALALASFAAAPGEFALPTLQGVGQPSDYQLVMVAAADPDRARTWIEQVGPTLGDTPLVMILSAQAEPLVRPYYDAAPRQVQGMLTGLTGALIYETNTAQQSGATRDWAPFNVGLALGVTLMLLGAVYNLLSGRVPRRKATPEVKD